MLSAKGVTYAAVVAVVAYLCAVNFVAVSQADSTAETVVDKASNAGLFGPLFDVGRLWIRAIVEQFRRIVNIVLQLPDFTQPMTYIVGVPSVIVIYYLYNLLFQYMNRVRYLGSLGYIPNGSEPIKDVMEAVRRRREAGDLPPVYPNGWFSVAESCALAVGEVLNVHCLGKQLAVFRAEDGRAHVIDAYCPHNGANMAAGGIVRGNCLECPFHGWQFRGDDGKCTHIPYTERKNIPDIAKVTSYQSIERNGFIHIWYHAEGIDPTWEIPDLEQVSSGEWTYRGRTEHIVNAHIQEIPENGADVAHLSQVHGPIMTTGVDLRYTYNKWWSFARHDWSGQWNQHSDPDQKHVGILNLYHGVELFGIKFPLLDLQVEAKQIGPGIVYLTFDSPFGPGAFLQVLTPVEPLTLRLIHHVYFYKYTPTFIAKFFMYGEAMMVERDIMIWNNKRYVSKPLYVKSKEDALVQRHRRWYSQFYSEHSPKLIVSRDTDW